MLGTSRCISHFFSEGNEIEQSCIAQPGSLATRNCRITASMLVRNRTGIAAHTCGCRFLLVARHRGIGTHLNVLPAHLKTCRNITVLSSSGGKRFTAATPLVSSCAHLISTPTLASPPRSDAPKFNLCAFLFLFLLFRVCCAKRRCFNWRGPPVCSTTYCLERLLPSSASCNFSWRLRKSPSVDMRSDEASCRSPSSSSAASVIVDGNPGAAAAAADTGVTAKATKAAAVTTARVGIFIAVMLPLDTALPFGHPKPHTKRETEKGREHVRT